VKIAALLLLVVGFLAAGGVAARQALEEAPPAVAKEARAQDPDAKPADKQAPGPAVVRVMKPLVGGLDRTTGLLDGTVVAAARADVHAAVPGVLKGQLVDIGDRVKKGDVLAEIDAPLLALAEKQAEAAVQQAQGVVREAEAKILTARAEVQAAKSVIVQREAELSGARATSTSRLRQYERIKEQHKAGVVEARLLDETEGKATAAKALVDAAAAALTNAKADLEVKQSKIAQAEAGVTTAKAGVLAARIELEKAALSLSLTKVRAPFDGVVTQRNFWPGDYLRSADGRQLPLVTVQRMDHVRVTASVTEGDVPLLKVGAPAELSFPSLSDVRFPGVKVSRFAVALDPTNRTMRVEVDVPNPKGQLRPGMFGRLSVHLGKGPADALRIPRSCFVPHLDNEPVVYVVVGGKAHRTKVSVSPWTVDDEVEVLSGLKAGDLVVTDPKGLKGDVVVVTVKEKPASK
jgi:RND family efflux transporter MFP subunit